MSEDPNDLLGRVPYKAQLPTPQQVAATLAALTLAGPMALGGMPVIPITVNDEQRRRQDEILQVSESSVGIHQSVAEAEESLCLSQQRLARVTREVEEIHARDIQEQDVIQAANRVFSGEVEKRPERRFRTAFTNVAWDTVDLLILRDG